MPQDATELQAEGDGPNWSDYYRHTQGREQRPLFVRGLEALAAAGLDRGQAVEIGFGDGTETLALLNRGWNVLAIDPTPDAAGGLLARVPPEDLDRLEVRTAGGEAEPLPPFDLLYAGYALSFIRPERFRAFWSSVRDRVRPDGFLVVNIFGVRDSWAGDPEMTFVDRPMLDQLIDGLDVIEVREEDADGPAFSGPKHWHLFDVIARRPPNGARRERPS